MTHWILNFSHVKIPITGSHIIFVQVVPQVYCCVAEKMFPHVLPDTFLVPLPIISSAFSVPFNFKSWVYVNIIVAF